MDSYFIHIIVLAAVALFLVLRLKNLLGTRDGFERPSKPIPKSRSKSRKFDVIDGGGEDFDITDHVEADSETGKALAEMKRVDPNFTVNEFMRGSRQAYEMILMAFENGDTGFLKQFLSPDVFEGFSEAIKSREEKGLSVEAEFGGVREAKITNVSFNVDDFEAEITMKFLAEISSVVRDQDGKIVEGDLDKVKRQSDVWTFARVMNSDNPNWLLVGTGE